MISLRFSGSVTGTLRARRASAVDIDRCIHVCMSRETTVPAGVASLALAASLVDGSTVRTFLGRVGGIDLHERPAALFQLVTERCFKRAPALLQYPSVQAVLSAPACGHVDDLQILDTDQAEAIGNASRNLVPPIGADAGDLCGQRRDVPTLLAVTVGSPNAAGEDALRSLLPPLKLGRAGDGKKFASREGQGVRDPAINANARQVVGRRLMFDFAGQADVPAKRIAVESSRDNAATPFAGHAHLDEANLRHSDKRPLGINRDEPDFAAFVLESAVRSGRSEGGKPSTSEEGGIGRVKLDKSLRQWRGMNLRKPFALSPQLRHFTTLRGVVEIDSARLGLPPEIAPLFQGQIVDEPHRTSRLSHGPSLLRRRVKAVSEAPVNHALFYAVSVAQATGTKS